MKPKRPLPLPFHRSECTRKNLAIPPYLKEYADLRTEFASCYHVDIPRSTSQMLQCKSRLQIILARGGWVMITASFLHFGPEHKYWVTCSLVRSIGLLVCLLCTLSFARMFCCAHSFAGSLAHSLSNLWESESLHGCSCCGS